MNNPWWKEAVVYQIYTKSFMDSDGDGIGDLMGVISKLDYLKELGIDIVWLTPINLSPDRDNGYDISDYRTIQPAYGTAEDFNILISELHKRDMKLVMDLVVNHTSNDHDWYKKSSRDTSCKEHGYYYWCKKPNNWNAYFGGSAWTKSEYTGEYSLGVFSPYQPDLNWTNPKLRAEIYDMMRFWLDKGIDGFRLDAIACIGKADGLPDSKDSLPLVKDESVHTYLKEMRKEVLSKYDIMTVGEASGIGIDDMLKFAGDDSGELNMMIQFTHVELDNDENYKWNLKRISLPKLKKHFDEWQRGLYGKAWNALYWNNHDQPRAVSRLGCDEGELREKSAEMIAVSLHMMQGTPFVFQGEELGMTNMRWNSIDEINDIESINAYEDLTQSGKYTPEEMLRIISCRGRDNARTPMQWSSAKNAGFTTGTPWLKVNPNYKSINASEQINRENSVYGFYKKLIKLRHENEIIIDGTCRFVDIDNENVLSFVREYHGQIWLVVCNFSQEEKCFDYERFIDGKVIHTVIGNWDDSEYINTKKLKPYEAVVLRTEAKA
jgi:oligo-1,6-glucosidase